MLERTLEPEVMDSPDEATTYDEMDHAEVNRLFVQDLLAVGDLGTDILDLGTGTARIPIELCRQNDDVRVLAVDLAYSMLDVAKLNIEIANVADRVTLGLVDAKALEYEDGAFSTVMSNSIVHHVPEPAVALTQAVRVTKSGGLLFFRDLMRPESSSEVDRLVAEYAGDESDHAREMFYNSLHAALSLDEIRAMVEKLGFAGDTVQPTSDRHWTWVGRKN
ncbi:MAG: class I SAM-dependent methyltransferase [Planctomycetales bacterium]|nr:class I SAM-dependent methyltransferase [Planctomycetales bacterium]